MKGAKSMTHSQLIAEVIKATQTRGVLGVPDIKKNIDKLIEKGKSYIVCSPFARCTY